MKITKRQLRRIIKEEKAKLVMEQPKEDVDFDPAEVEGLNLPEYLKKMLDPNVSKEQYSKLDMKVDDSGNVSHQGMALAGFALSYGDMQPDKVKMILSKAQDVSKKILAARAAAEKKAGGSATAEVAESFRITRSELQKIIKEEKLKLREMYLDDVGGDRGAHVVDYLKSQARSYHLDRSLDVDGDGNPDVAAIKTLLQDDFMDNFGHEFEMVDFNYEIDNFAHGAGLR